MTSEGGRRYSGSSGVTWTSIAMVIAGVVSLIGTGIGLRFFASVSHMAAGLWCGSMVSFDASIYKIIIINNTVFIQ